MLIKGISSQSTKLHYEFGVIQTQKDDAWTSGAVDIATVILFISKVDKFEAIDKVLTKNILISCSGGQNREFIVDKGFIDSLITGFCPEDSYVIEIYCGGFVLEESLLNKRRCIALCKDELEAIALESKCSTLLNDHPSVQEWCGASDDSTKGQPLDDAEKENLQNFQLDDQPSTEDEGESDDYDSKNDTDDDKEVGDAVDSEDEGQSNKEDQGDNIRDQGNEDIGQSNEEDKGDYIEDQGNEDIGLHGGVDGGDILDVTDVNKTASSPSSSLSKKDMHKEGEDKDNTAQLEQKLEIPTTEISPHDLNSRGNKDNMVEVDHRSKETEGNPDLQVHVEVSESTDKITEQIQEAITTKEIQEDIIECIDEAACSIDKEKTIESKDFPVQGENKEKVSEEIQEIQEVVATKEIQETKAACGTDKGIIVESKDFVPEGASASNNQKSSVQEVDQRVEELRSDTQKSRPLGSLYSFERYGDKLVFQSSPINREIQLSLGDIMIDEYGSMKRK